MIRQKARPIIRRYGFTIVELLVVIVVIGILAAITIVSYAGISSRATVSSLQSDLTNALTQLKLDQVTNSMFPSSLSSANGGKGIPSSSGTSYTYAVSNTTTPQTFCITATKNNISYNITGDGNPQPGICPVLNLDAGNISSYPGTGTTWTDLSGNGNSGTLYGGVTYSAVNGGVLGFDGGTGYVRTAVLPATNSFAISIWFKTTTVRDGDRLYWGNGSNNAILANSGTSGKLQWYVQTATTSVGYAVTNNSFNINTWNNVILQYTGSQVQCFINGIQDGVTANITGVSNASAFNLGTNYNNSGNWYNGTIGNVSIYNRSLNSDEITQIFNIFRGRYGL